VEGQNVGTQSHGNASRKQTAYE